MMMRSSHKLWQSADIIKGLFTLVLASLLLAACPRPEPGPISPLQFFSDKVAQLVTTSVRSFVRNDSARQELLTNQLSSLERNSSLELLYQELENIELLKQLAVRIRADVEFVLADPENEAIKKGFNEPDIQKDTVSAVIRGMKTAMENLQGGGHET